MNAVTLEHLRAGYCTAPGALAQRGESWRRRTFPAGITLIQHPAQGLTLFDAGYSRTAVAALRRWPDRIYGTLLPVTLPPGEALVEQLAARGVDPAGVRRIICSHLHLDHLAGAVDFPGAPVWLDPAERDALTSRRGLAALRHGILAAAVPEESRLRSLSYTPAPPGLAPFERASDFFGDQSLWLVPSPGHTTGSIAAVARTRPDARLDGDGAGLVLLTGDVAWSERALREGIEPHRLTRRIAAHDPAGATHTAGLWREWLIRHPEAQVVVSHDESTHGDGRAS